MTNIDDINRVRQEADQLYSQKEVEQAFDRMAEQVTGELADRDPVVVCVLTGGIGPTAKLIERLDFALTTDVIHASRYQEATSGSEINWISFPRSSLDGRLVLVVDDILDEGLTLEAISQFCTDQGAAAVYSAVLVEKRLGRAKPHQADFVGLEAENRYLFGCGMDYKGYWRNLPGIYACKRI